MSSKLGQRDKELLNAHITKRVGQRPYEDGLWGSQGNRDFAYLEIYDSQNNLIGEKRMLDYAIKYTNSRDIKVCVALNEGDSEFSEFIKLPKTLNIYPH